MNFLIIGLLFVSSVFAETPAMELENKTKDFSEVLETQESGKTLSITNIRLRTSLDAGVQIPGMTNATVSPEIELFFTKN